MKPFSLLDIYDCKAYLRVDFDFDDYLIEMMLDAAKSYVKNYTKRTQEDLNQCQTLIAGAVQLMYDRLMGNTEFDISERQYNQFLVDAKEKTKLFTWGYETLDETAEWVFDAIHVEYEE